MTTEMDAARGLGSDEARARPDHMSRPGRKGPPRPPGWIAPGPRPAGDQGRLELLPSPDEDLSYLLGDWQILQRRRGHRWSIDDLATAWFAGRQVSTLPDRILDLGCGIGSVLMMMAWQFPSARCIGVEAQLLSAGLARRSLELNGAFPRCQVIESDFRDLSWRAQVQPSSLIENGFPLITGTPPYIPIGSGFESEREQCGPCRFEHRGGLEDYCQTAAALLAPEGCFVACAGVHQAARVEPAATAAGLRIRSSLIVIPKEGKPPLFTVHAMVPLEPSDGMETSRTMGLASASASTEGTGGKADVRPMSGWGMEERLVVRQRDGRWSDAFLALRKTMGLPPRP